MYNAIVQNLESYSFSNIKICFVCNIIGYHCMIFFIFTKQYIVNIKINPFPIWTKFMYANYMSICAKLNCYLQMIPCVKLNRYCSISVCRKRSQTSHRMSSGLSLDALSIINDHWKNQIFKWLFHENFKF